MLKLHGRIIGSKKKGSEPSAEEQRKRPAHAYNTVVRLGVCTKMTWTYPAEFALAAPGTARGAFRDRMEAELTGFRKLWSEDGRGWEGGYRPMNTVPLTDDPGYPKPLSGYCGERHLYVMPPDLNGMHLDGWEMKEKVWIRSVVSRVDYSSGYRWIEVCADFGFDNNGLTTGGLTLADVRMEFNADGKRRPGEEAPEPKAPEPEPEEPVPAPRKLVSLGTCIRVNWALPGCLMGDHLSDEDMRIKAACIEWMSKVESFWNGLEGGCYLAITQPGEPVALSDDPGGQKLFRSVAPEEGMGRFKWTADAAVDHIKEIESIRVPTDDGFLEQQMLVRVDLEPVLLSRIIKCSATMTFRNDLKGKKYFELPVFGGSDDPSGVSKSEPEPEPEPEPVKEKTNAIPIEAGIKLPTSQSLGGRRRSVKTGEAVNEVPVPLADRESDSMFSKVTLDKNEKELAAEKLMIELGVPRDLWCRKGR